MLLLLLINGVASSATTTDTLKLTSCYTLIDTTTPYDILEKAVGSLRECEILCDGKFTCSGFSYRSTSLIDPCVLLSSAIPNKMCAAKTSIYVKGCGNGGPITLNPSDEPNAPTTSATSPSTTTIIETTTEPMTTTPLTTTESVPSMENPAATTTTFSGGALRMIGYVEVTDPSPLKLQVYKGTRDVSNDAQWNTAKSIIIDVLASGCTITVTDEAHSYTANANTAKAPQSFLNIKQVEGICST